MKNAIATKNKVVAIALFLLCTISSVYFPGAGFLVYFPTKRFLAAHRRVTVITLMVIEVAHFLTAIGTQFGPILSHSSK